MSVLRRMLKMRQTAAWLRGRGRRAEPDPLSSADFGPAAQRSRFVRLCYKNWPFVSSGRPAVCIADAAARADCSGNREQKGRECATWKKSLSSFPPSLLGRLRTASGAIFVIGSSPGTARRQTSRQRRNYFNQFETELKVRSARRYGVAP
jgi:hypothetical protein